MELLQLEYFYAVAKTQHVTHTAEQLHIAQPALTQSIHRLEKGTGKNRNICIFTLGILNQPEIQSAMGFLIGNQGVCDQCRGSQYIHSNGTFPDVCHFLQYFRQLMQIFQNRL